MMNTVNTARATGCGRTLYEKAAHGWSYELSGISRSQRGRIHQAVFVTYQIAVNHSIYVHEW